MEEESEAPQTLEDLLKDFDRSTLETPEMQAWFNTPPVGQEFGSPDCKDSN